MRVNFNQNIMKNRLKLSVNRRDFLKKSGGAIVAGSLLPVTTSRSLIANKETMDVEYRILGRTGFKVYPVAIGGFCQNVNVYKRAIDLGVNHIDTAEGYYRGNSERTVGKAIQGMDRKKLFITTKLGMDHDETKDNILKRFRKSLDRLDSDYYDALYIHGVEDIRALKNDGFHDAVKQLKEEGRLMHAGISCHGTEDGEGDPFEKVLTAAASDGRFNLMLFNYNFMNKEEAERVIQICKEKNVGTVAMKTSPGIETPFGDDTAFQVLDDIDPENLTEEQEEFVKELMDEDDIDRSEAIEEMQAIVEEHNEGLEDLKPYIDKYGITSSEELRKVSLKWVLENPDMNTVTITMASFSAVDTFVPLAGEQMTTFEREMIHDYAEIFNNRYCRHGCSACVEACPNGLPVSRIMRYNYYFQLQGREKYAMTRYNELSKKNAALCNQCPAPCTGACPYGLNIQANLKKAHNTLTIT